MHLPTPGTLFQGKYEILQPLGTGGFATVFLAHDSEVQRDVAIKVLAPMEGGYPSTVVARFMVEARIIARLRDAHTIRLFEFGESEDGLLFMVFQYVDGADLGAVLAGRGALPPEVAVHIAVQVLQALAEAHAIGVFHRDIKPGNILVHHYMGDDHAVKLLDFGIAKIDEDRAGLTKTGTMVGTPRYMSPEQVFGEPVTAASDIYSVGVVIYEMLVGRPAIAGDRKEILARHAEQAQHQVPRSIAWPALRAVVDRMMARDPRARFAAAGEAIAALEQAMRERSSSGPPMQLARPSAPPEDAATTPLVRPVAPESVTSRNGGWPVLLAALVVSLGVGVVAFLLTQSAESPTVGDQQPSLPDELLSAPAPPRQPVLTRTPEVASRDLGHPEDDAANEEAADGCGRTYPAMDERHLTIGPGRTALVYLPDDYDPHRRYPIILGFGPKYRTDSSFAKDARLTRLGAEPVIVIVIMPEDRLASWQHVDDIAVVRDGLDAAEASFCVDRRRIFGVGYHDGGKFLRELACRVPLSGLAFVGFAEQARIQYCEINPVVPTLWVLGKKDDFIPLEGGQGCTTNIYHPAEKHDEIWLERNDCERGSPRVLSKTSSSQCRVWSCRAAYASCRADGGHYLNDTDWALLFPFCAKRDLKFKFAKEAWNFFQQHGAEIADDDPRHVTP